MTAETEQVGHNPLFNHFVKDNASQRERLQGFVAYSLYKQAKREWASKKAQKPTDQELRDYVDTWTPSRLEGLSEQAEGILDVFGNAFVEAARPRIREEALRGTFWTAFWPAVLAAATYSTVLIVVAFILKFSGVDIVEIFHHVGEVK